MSEWNILIEAKKRAVVEVYSKEKEEGFLLGVQWAVQQISHCVASPGPQALATKGFPLQKYKNKCLENVCDFVEQAMEVTDETIG